MKPNDLKHRIASIYSSKETGVPVPIITEMLYDVMKKENEDITRGSIRKLIELNPTTLQATKKLFLLATENEDK